MNHTYETDWLFGWIFCEKVGVLGNCKAYAKKVIQYIPTVGWSWKFAEFVFLERSFDKDREIIKKQLNEIFDYPDPVWVSFSYQFSRMI
jgi:lysophosphatidic acid acyltransferase/lysophosphatidylinositol acyltransferase